MKVDGAVHGAVIAAGTLSLINSSLSSQAAALIIGDADDLGSTRDVTIDLGTAAAPGNNQLACAAGPALDARRCRCEDFSGIRRPRRQRLRCCRPDRWRG